MDSARGSAWRLVENSLNVITAAGTHTSQPAVRGFVSGVKELQIETFWNVIGVTPSSCHCAL